MECGTDIITFGFYLEIQITSPNHDSRSCLLVVRIRRITVFLGNFVHIIKMILVGVRVRSIQLRRTEFMNNSINRTTLCLKQFKVDPKGPTLMFNAFFIRNRVDL